MNGSSREVLRFGGAALALANAVMLLLSFIDAVNDEEAIEAARSTATLPTLLLILGSIAVAISFAGER